MALTRQEKWLKQTTDNHREQEQGQDHTTPMAAPGAPISAVNRQHAFDVARPLLLGWKKSFEKLNTQVTCEFMVISQLLGGQF